ncbi:hypothetical protein ABFS82_10G050600 [Erythranthe guttata]|uniref:cytochrome P450 94C1-like n=1 Tax=Erythranthe guttata TaxID=4155 RepID=UPI00064E0F27|nr:PREDICTED: cytochrome P450 94C1-like [Erythranthe guttata]|eukprot:XP_012840133.1 PREDICTED: cytochrome P450 94C1-like [Erythranthe guttata]
MESASSWLQSLILLLFSLIIIIIIIILLIIRLRKYWCCCNCGICKAYIESSWRVRFPNLCDWYTHLLRNSPTRTIHIHALNNTITANPENVEHMLKTRFHNYPKGKPFSAILGDFLGRGIFNSDGDSWRFQRRIASLELGRVSIRAYSSDVANQEIRRYLLPVMESAAAAGRGGNGALDLQDVFRRFSFFSICRFSFGLDPDIFDDHLSLPLSQFAAAFDSASELSAERAMSASPIIWKVKRLLNVGSERKLRRAIGTVHVLAGEFISQRRRSADFKSSSDQKKDLMSRFMASVADETYLRDIIVSFLLAGRDTVASALTSFFMLVARHPRVEATILLEAEKVIGPHNENRPASYEQLRELHYLHAAVHESMRLYPPIQFNSKFCSNDDVLPDGTFVKKGTRVTYHPYAMGRMEEIWGPDCLDFKPERWLNKDGVFFHDQNPFKYPVFQAGIRVCLGREVALVEIKTVAISLLRSFHLELVDENIPRFSPGLTATFRHGLQVFVRARIQP